MTSKTKAIARAEGAKPALVPKLRFPEFRAAPSWAGKPMGQVYSFKGNNSLSRDQLNYELGSVKNIHYGDIHTKFATLFDITKERVPFINPSESLAGFRADNDCVEGDMIFADASEDLADIGKSIEIVRLNGERLVAGQHTILARSNDESLAIGFGAYLFTSPYVRTQIQKESQGSKVLGISATRMTRIQLPIPSELGEQQKIAECLSSVDQLMAAQARKVSALKTHKKGLMQQLFPREGETQPRRRFSSAEDWAVAALPEVAFFQEGPGIMAVDFHAKGVPLVRLAGVSGPVVTLDGCNYLDPAKVAQKWTHFRLEVNDLLISTSATFGLSALVTEAAAGAVFYTGLIRFRPRSGRLDRVYLEIFLGSPHFARQAETAAVGGGIKHFGPSHLKQMEIPIPPLAEQKRIATCLSSLDALIAAETQKHDALKAHKKGLMQQLFPSPEAVEV
jgi:type I restriction enzyme S subunit